MPMTLNGSAHHNIANIAAASIAAHALGVTAPVIASVLARFGSDPEDNPGRLQHFEFGGIHAFLDFAHNPDGIRGLLAIATPLRASGRLAVTIGQAGDRSDKDLHDLADAAADARPGLVVVKELKGYERGRAEGEVAGILASRLRQRGLRESQVIVELDEVAAAGRVLSWALRGDVLVLPTHARAARAAVDRLLATLHRTGWQPGQPLPTPDPPDERSG
ncbi:MAG TPA: cyanophycin synthetase [Thermomicrobiales bacterium]|nr:cyanophycin synthetase [Thermomicrobiales bacterium]